MPYQTLTEKPQVTTKSWFSRLPGNDVGLFWE